MVVSDKRRRRDCPELRNFIKICHASSTNASSLDKYRCGFSSHSADRCYCDGNLRHSYFFHRTNLQSSPPPRATSIRKSLQPRTTIRYSGIGSHRHGMQGGETRIRLTAFTIMYNDTTSCHVLARQVSRIDVMSGRTYIVMYMYHQPKRI